MQSTKEEGFDLKNYEKLRKLFFNDKIRFYEVINQKTEEKNICKIWKKTLNDFRSKKILDLYREVNILSKIHHPSFLKFIGFSSSDFKSKSKPVIIFEHISKGPLSLILNPEDNIMFETTLEEDENNIQFNDTQKLILLYGIASGMAYLHSQDIIHRNLNPSSIFLDDSYFPKIAGFDIVKDLSKSLPLTESRKDSKLKGEHFYLAPEVWSNLEYDKASDVYSFSLLMYEILTSKTPLKRIDEEEENEEEEEENEEDVKFEFDEEIPNCYVNLIKKCSSKNPNDRPTFSEIESELKNNPEFITNNVNEIEYKNYINFIENSNISFDTEKVIDEMNSILKLRKNAFFESNKIDLNLRGPLNSTSDLDIQQYKTINSKYIISTVNRESNIQFHVEFSNKEINSFLRHEIINFARCVNIMAQLNHPSIIKFVGYSQIDFTFRPKPVFITEDFAPFDIIKDYTQKLIYVYGVASGMAYLHSHNIIHRNLKPENIVTNKYGFPKIYGFDIAKEIKSDKIELNKTIKGTPIYIAPEVYLNKGYSKKSDVYSFGLIMYEIFTEDQPFDNEEFNSPSEIKNSVVFNESRPKFIKPINSIYKNLIERCWSTDPNNRPTFDQILIEIKTNPDFITDSVDKEAFFDFVSYIDEFNVTFDPSRKVKQLDDILNNKINSFPNIRPLIHFKDMFSTETNNLYVDDDFYLNENDFQCSYPIRNGSFYEVTKTFLTKTDEVFVNKKSFVRASFYKRYEIINFSRELNILLQLNHPSILKFFGYTLHIHGEPIIYTEFCSNGPLDRIIKLQRINKNDDEKEDKETNDANEEIESQKEEKESNDAKDDDNNESENDNDSINNNVEKNDDNNESVNDNENNGKEEEEEEYEESSGCSIKEQMEKIGDTYYNKNVHLDCTKKLIIINGIAAGMSYLHLHNILHRDLKPNNIYLDDSLYPKISGFNIAKEMKSDKIEPNKSIKGTPIYIAPEVYLNKGYSKKSDVYSFSLIMYEIITEEQPFDDSINSPFEIKNKIVIKNERPKFVKPINSIYRNLIERCWSPDPDNRPTFDEILTELKTNPDFITSDINNEEYQSYIKHIEQSPILFESSKRINDLESFIRNRKEQFEEVNCQINFRPVFETEFNNVKTDFEYANIEEYEKQHLLRNFDDFNHSKVYSIKNKKTKKSYIAKVILKSRKESDSYRYFNLSHEIDHLIKVNHPLFLKFIKFSPIDFKKRQHPVLIFESAINGTLERMIMMNKRKKGEPILTDTKKLILLYGIASAMAYLHSINIIHCRLNPSNIYLNDFLFPKLSGFDESKILNKNPIIPLSDLLIDESLNEDYSIYNAPEIMKSAIYSSASDVYSFAVIAYELITDETPFQDDQCYDGYRPIFKETTPIHYKNLISKCWDQDPKERPTFEEIVHHIKTSQEFITNENIDKEEFLNFVHLIEDINEKSDNNKYFELNNYIQNQNQRFRKIQLNYSKLTDWLRINLNVNIGSSDLNMFSKQRKIGNGSFGNVYKIIEKQNDIIYAAKISIYEMDQCSEDTILNLSREIDIISTIQHPSILKFIGFSPTNFKNKSKPVIITEYAFNGSLEKLLRNIRNGLGNIDWDDTKKLINIYGIAAGMAYINNRDIIHRDLKPDNILLDEFLYPKIADFGMAKNLDDESNNKKHILSGFKGTYAYAAPEVIQNHHYGFSGDVYSFAMIMFEIMTNEKPFGNISNIYQLLLLIQNGYRPKFNVPIPYCYKKLIQKCWNNNPDERPSFNKICSILTTDPNFITSNVNKEEYLNYVEYVNELLQSSSNNNNNNNETNEGNKIIKNKLNKEGEKINEIDDEEINIIDDNNYFLDLNNYSIEDIIFKKDTFKLCKIREKETQNEFVANISMIKTDLISDKEKEKLINYLKIISQLNHPSLLKFIGFSLIDFKKQRKPVIVTELFTNGVLEQILELEKMNKKISGWDNTKKLINIYGIASAMSNMHSHNILHCCLSPSNVYLDEILCPKIGDFGLFTKLTNSHDLVHQSMSGTKGTPIYTAPEVLESSVYTKASDVYSFALVVYEILSNEKPFIEIENISLIYKKIVTNAERPKMNDSIPNRFKKLIEDCWAQNPNERLDFNEIVYQLKMDEDFISNDVNKEDYEKYINFIESKTITESAQKIKEI